MAVVGKKANRFFSRRMAELNEARTKGAATRDLHPELVASIGKEVTERHEISEEIKLQAKVRMPTLAARAIESVGPSPLRRAYPARVHVHACICHTHTLFLSLCVSACNVRMCVCVFLFLYLSLSLAVSVCDAGRGGLARVAQRHLQVGTADRPDPDPVRRQRARAQQGIQARTHVHRHAQECPVTCACCVPVPALCAHAQRRPKMLAIHRSRERVGH
jgi:hypothetical protein